MSTRSINPRNSALLLERYADCRKIFVLFFLLLLCKILITYERKTISIGFQHGTLAIIYTHTMIPKAINSQSKDGSKCVPAHHSGMTQYQPSRPIVP